MRGKEFIAPSNRQRWGVILVALVVAGVVVTRGGTPQPTQAEFLQPWHEDVDAADPDHEPQLDSQKGEPDSLVTAAGSKSK